jgi:hypothetical protein
MTRDLEGNTSLKRQSRIFIWLLVILLCLPLTYIFFKQIVSTVSSNPGAVIKNVKVYQAEGAVVGRPVKWTAVVNLKDIINGEHLVEIPKSAKNVKVKTITAEEAKELETIKSPQLTLEERKSLVYGSNNSFATSLGLSVKMFFAEAESVVQTVVESITSPSGDSQTVDVAPIIEQPAVETPASTETPALSPNSETQNLTIKKDEFIAVEYTTEGITIKETKTKTGKIVTVSIPDETVISNSQFPMKL